MHINDDTYEQTLHFEYLGYSIQPNGRAKVEVKIRADYAKTLWPRR